MSTDPERQRRWSTLSHTHEDVMLRQQNDLYARAESLRPDFTASADDAARAARRESFMVKRQQPRPVLRPGPELARGPDGAAFDAQWSEECARARWPNDARER
jgi:hypothetical protein